MFYPGVGYEYEMVKWWTTNNNNILLLYTIVHVWFKSVFKSCRKASANIFTFIKETLSPSATYMVTISIPNCYFKKNMMVSDCFAIVHIPVILLLHDMTLTCRCFNNNNIVSDCFDIVHIHVCMMWCLFTTTPMNDKLNNISNYCAFINIGISPWLPNARL